MNKIIRTGTRSSGGITPDERKKMKLISEKWIRNAFQIGKIDKVKITDAIERLYSAAGLDKPRVVIVPSPDVMAYAYGIASAWWAIHPEKSNTSADNATDAATRAAIDAATEEATDNATYAATRAATDEATYDATDAATDEATDDATYAATEDATDAATRAATRAVIDAATEEATEEATRAATEDATDAATRAATHAAIDAATEVATYKATYAATFAATRAATYAATRAAIDAATDEATYDATDAATRAATYAATRAAIDAATEEATDNATYAATRAATDEATYDATDAATRAATFAGTWLKRVIIDFLGKENFNLGINNIKRWRLAYQGGNMWSGFPTYAEACRDVLKLNKLKCWEKYQAWEDCAKYGGFRVMHAKFCMVCDFPEKLHALPDGKLHCETGPSHRWRTGFELYHLNGIKVPKWLVMTPASEIDVNLALNEKNVDVQREIIRKIGAERFLQETNAKEIDKFTDKTGLKYTLQEMKVGTAINRKYLYFEHATMKGVWYAKPVPPECRKALHARAWILGLIEREDLNATINDTDILEQLPEVVQ